MGLAGRKSFPSPLPGGGPPAPVAEDIINLQEKKVVVKFGVIARKVPWQKAL